MSDTQPPPRQSPLFNASDADVIFQSADNVLFSIHRKNLESTTGAFPPADFSTEGQNVMLSETSATLELMFRYIYPMPQPNISLIPFEVLAPLAEAAEKYEVFPAIFVCKLHMQKFIPGHRREILGYAIKHGYDDLIGETAYILLAVPLHEALSQLPVNLAVPWALYYSAWDKILLLARSFPADPEFRRLRAGMAQHFHDGPTDNPEKCRTVGEAFCDALMALDGVRALRNTANLFISQSACAHVQWRFNTWRSNVQAEISAMRPFAAYLDSYKSANAQAAT